MSFSEAATSGAPILIVEDDPSTLDTYARMLRLQGYQVRTATSGELAWHEAETHPPEAIIVDFQLPKMTGLDFLRRVRQSAAHRRTHAALVTGNYYLGDEVVNELRHLEVTLRFKPLWFEDLEGLIRQLLRGDQLS